MQISMISKQGRPQPTALLMAAAMFTFVLASLFAPHAAEARSTYPAAITGNYANSNLSALCANCHINWGGRAIGNANRIDYNIWQATGVIPTAGSAFYTNDMDMDGISTGDEYTKSMSATVPPQTAAAPNNLNNWFPSFSDKDGDGCIQLYTRTNEAGTYLAPAGVTTNGLIGGFGFATYTPRGWDVDDNDPAQGCSAAWTTASVPTAPGTTGDAVPPAAVADFRASALASAAIPLVWTAVGDDNMTGNAHDYDLRYSTQALVAASLNCGAAGSSAAGTSACNVRDPAHWRRMADIPDDQVFAPGWNKGAITPLMRALYEPIPSAPGTVQACNTIGQSAICTANPGASYVLAVKGVTGAQVPQTNVIANGTTYWLAVRTADGVVKSGGTVEAPAASIEENVSQSNIIAVTAGLSGTGVAISSIVPRSLTTSIPVTVTGFGFSSTQVTAMVLTDSAGTVISTATAPLTITPTSVVGKFPCPLADGTYNLELRNGAATTNAKAAWVNAIAVTGYTCVEPAVLTSVTPNSRGQGASNQALDLVGTNFASPMTITFSDANITGTVVVNSATSATASIETVGATVGTGTVSVNGSNTVAFSVTAAPVIINCVPTSGTATIAYSYTCTGSAGATWTAIGLPAGLSINASNGVISGTPTTEGTYVGSVTLTDPASAGASSTGVSIVINPAPTVPSAPTNITVIPANGRCAVSFDPASDGGSPIIGYTVTGAPSGSGTGVASPITVIGLINFTTYTFTVTATNSVGTGPASVASAACIPTDVVSAPLLTLSTATIGLNGTTATLGATITSNSNADITHYGTCWATTANPTTNCVDQGTAAPTLPLTFTQERSGLAACTTYHYRGFATNAATPTPFTGYSPDATFTTACLPGAPTNVVATAGNASASVAFVAPVNNGNSPITSYTVSCSPVCTPVSGPVSPITVTGLNNGTAYTFTVKATNGVGTGAASTASNSVTPNTPPVVTLPTYAGVTNTTATLGATVTSATPLSARGICWGIAAAPTACFTSGTPAGTFTQAVSGLPPRTIIFFRGYATNAYGTSYSADGTFTTLGAPDAPTIVSTTPSSNLISVYFTAPVYNGGATVTGYTVSCSPACSPVTAATSPITVTGLTAGTTYALTMTATNIYGTSVPSVAVNVSTIAPVTVPDAPTIVSAVAGDTQAVLSFTAPANDGGAAIIGYTVNCLPSTAAVWWGSASPITVTGLTNYTAYSCTMTATNVVGTGPASAPVIVTPVPPAYVDLVMSAVTNSAASVHAGTTFVIDNTEKNQGTVKMVAASNSVRFYLSADSTISTSDILLTGSRFVGRLAAGATSVASTTVTVPKTMEPGVYYVGACADAGLIEVEVDEANNCSATTTNITVIRDVDLVMASVAAGVPSVGTGSTFPIDSVERNQGTTKMTVASNVVRFYLSADNIITTGDIALTGARFVTAIAAGTDSALATTTVTVPKTTAPGTYFVGACADVGLVQPETNELNNCSSTTATITVIRDVDLVMTVVNSAATSVAAGGTFTVDSVECNNGTTPMTVSSNSVRFYLSADNVITSADSLLSGARFVTALGAGVCSALGTTTVTVPKLTVPGAYFIGACADGTNVQVESNELNNCMMGTGPTITVVRNVDLIMTGIATTAITVARGTSFVIDNTETNQGTTPMTAITNAIKFYLSVDPTIATTDIPLTGLRTVSALAAGASSTASTTVTVPLSVAAGTYYIGAIADVANVQPESNETNNTSSPSVVTIIVN